MQQRKLEAIAVKILITSIVTGGSRYRLLSKIRRFKERAELSRQE
jgi:hypothetical protein